MESITSRQRKQILRFVEDRLDTIGLTKGGAQSVVARGNEMQDKFEAIIREIAKSDSGDKRFTLVSSFEMTVPDNYDHDTQLANFASFAEKKSEKFYYFNDSINDANYAKASNRLVPGGTYGVKIFQITTRVTSTDCLAFLKSQKAILVGAQGISLARQKAKEKFSIGRWTVSFDEKDALWEDSDGLHRVPCINRSSDGDWTFHLGYFEHDWDDDYCLFCLCDLSAEQADS